VVDRRGFLAGLGVALAAALPPTLVVQVLDATGDGDVSAAVTVPVALLVLAAMGLGGAVAARGSERRAVPTAAVAALAAMALVQVLGIVRRSAAGHDVAWASVPVLTVLGVAVAAGSALAQRRAGRTRP
jgi:hypothetical protein